MGERFDRGRGGLLPRENELAHAPDQGPQLARVERGLVQVVRVLEDPAEGNLVERWRALLEDQ
eukprot:5385656-Alexandrium_andersonii.AAC.1